jgi:hypothetical protein
MKKSLSLARKVWTLEVSFLLKLKTVSYLTQTDFFTNNILYIFPYITNICNMKTIEAPNLINLQRTLCTVHPTYLVYFPLTTKNKGFNVILG